MMRAIIFVQLLYGVAVAVAFLVPFGRPRRDVEWYLVCLNWAIISLLILLFAATSGLHISLLAGTMVLGGFDAALTLQLVIFRRSRRRTRNPPKEEL